MVIGEEILGYAEGTTLDAYKSAVELCYQSRYADDSHATLILPEIPQGLSEVECERRRLIIGILGGVVCVTRSAKEIWGDQTRMMPFKMEHCSEDGTKQEVEPDLVRFETKDMKDLMRNLQESHPLVKVVENYEDSGQPNTAVMRSVTVQLMCAGRLLITPDGVGWLTDEGEEMRCAYMSNERTAHIDDAMWRVEFDKDNPCG